MAPGRPRDERKERQWQRWLGQWRRSGLSVRAFCSRHHLAEPSFYAWRKELRRRDAALPTFVPVRVVPDNAQTGDGSVTVVLAGGRTVRVGPGFDAATLRRVVAVLEEGPSC